MSISYYDECSVLVFREPWPLQPHHSLDKSAFVTFEINNVCYQTLQKPQKNTRSWKEKYNFPFNTLNTLKKEFPDVSWSVDILSCSAFIHIDLYFLVNTGHLYLLFAVSSSFFVNVINIISYKLSQGCGKHVWAFTEIQKSLTRK